MPAADHDPADTPDTAPKGRLRWLLDGGWVERDQAAAAFERMHRRDAIGDRIHLALACLAAFGLAGPTSAVEIAYLPLLVFFFVRAVNAGPTWIHWLGQPMMLGALALAAWQAIALAWSGDRALGLDHLGSLRWLVIGVLFWPVIERRRTIIAAFALGMLAGNASQLAHAIGTAAQIDWLTFPRAKFRNSGWWDPVVGGSLLTAALGLHLPAAILARGAARWLALAAAGITLAGILATGTRGAWLASAGLVAIAIVWGAWTAVRSNAWTVRGTLARGAVLAVVLAIAGGGVWFAAGDTLTRRYDKAREEITAAFGGDHDSDTGARISMISWATRAIVERPFTGVGTGGYRAWVEDQADDTNVHDHAHNAPLHIGATNGVVGLALAGFVVLVGLRAGLMRFPVAPGARGWSAYDAGPALAIVGLMLAGMFDGVHLNTQTAAVLGLMLGVCPCWSPRKEPRAKATGS
ncbi:MAG: O-antigen ligase family protein [Phycisphaerales bacterium]